jgi:hypothetical protein
MAQSQNNRGPEHSKVKKPSEVLKAHIRRLEVFGIEELHERVVQSLQMQRRVVIDKD